MLGTCNLHLLFCYFFIFFKLFTMFNIREITCGCKSRNITQYHINLCNDVSKKTCGCFENSYELEMKVMQNFSYLSYKERQPALLLTHSK